MATFSYAWCVPVSPESTQTNTFLANLASGAYARMAVSNIFRDIAPAIWNTLPIEFAPLEDEVGRFVERETQMGVKNLVKAGVGEMGLQGSLSLASCAVGPAAPSQSRRVSPRRSLRLHASASRDRLKLSLLWSF